MTYEGKFRWVYLISYLHLSITILNQTAVANCWDMGLTLLGVPTILAVYRVLAIILITKPITNNNYEYSKEVKLVEKTLFQCNITWIEQHPTLSWRCSTTIKLYRHNLFEYFNWYSTKPKKPNTAIIFALILLSGDVEINPGPPKFPCAICKKKQLQRITMHYNVMNATHGCMPNVMESRKRNTGALKIFTV